MGILKILGTSNPMVPRSHGNLYKPSIHKPNLSGFPKYPRWSISPDSLCSSDHKHGQGAKLTTRWPAKRGPKLEAGKCWANPQTLHSCSKRKPENPRAGVFFCTRKISDENSAFFPNSSAAIQAIPFSGRPLDAGSWNAQGNDGNDSPQKKDPICRKSHRKAATWTNIKVGRQIICKISSVAFSVHQSFFWFQTSDSRLR